MPKVQSIADITACIAAPGCFMSMLCLWVAPLEQVPTVKVLAGALMGLALGAVALSMLAGRRQGLTSGRGG